MATPLCNAVDYRLRFSSNGGVAAPTSFGFTKHTREYLDQKQASSRVTWRGDLNEETLQDLYALSAVDDQTPVLALVYIYGGWIPLPGGRSPTQDATSGLADSLETWLQPCVKDMEDCQIICANCQFTEDSVDKLDKLPPFELPALAVVSQEPRTARSVVEYLPLAAMAVLQRALHGSSRSSRHAAALVQEAIQSSILQVRASLGLSTELAVDLEKSREAIRIFVAGDRSSVGKSSVCLGILGNLLQHGYTPKDLAYIKPATQSESTQLIQIYCEEKGIACVPIGPLVYYRGFTRAYLAGETAPTEQLLASCGQAVDRLAQGKKVILMDGVGFPAVGSICGTDNAAVALACSYPLANGTRKPVGVLLVGGSGVGGAVDAFNLNTAYFERVQIPVMGAIFNKLSTDADSFYSLEKCREQVSKYFSQNEHQRRWNRRAFGFCPLYDGLKTNEKAQMLVNAEEWIKIFCQHVDVSGILQAAQRVKTSPNLQGEVQRPAKRPKIQEPVKVSTRAVLTRREIEQAAIRRGAPISA